MNPRPTLLAATETRNLAALALAEQVDGPGLGFGVDLDALWRAAGSIPGESPEEWLRLAAGLAQAVVGYRRAIEARACPLRAYQKRPATWHVSKQLRATIDAALEPADAALYELGDVMACETVAGVYATFVDQAAERRPFTDAGRVRRRAFLKLVDGMPPFHAPDPIIGVEPDALQIAAGDDQPATLSA